MVSAKALTDDRWTALRHAQATSIVAPSCRAMSKGPAISWEPSISGARIWTYALRRRVVPKNRHMTSCRGGDSLADLPGVLTEALVGRPTVRQRVTRLWIEDDDSPWPQAT